jgi:hypothetical protein
MSDRHEKNENNPIFTSQMWALHAVIGAKGIVEKEKTKDYHLLVHIAARNYCKEKRFEVDFSDDLSKIVDGTERFKERVDLFSSFKLTSIPDAVRERLLNNELCESPSTEQVEATFKIFQTTQSSSRNDWTPLYMRTYMKEHKSGRYNDKGIIDSIMKTQATSRINENFKKAVSKATKTYSDDDKNFTGDDADAKKAKITAFKTTKTTELKSTYQKKIENSAQEDPPTGMLAWVLCGLPGLNIAILGTGEIIPAASKTKEGRRALREDSTSPTEVDSDGESDLTVIKKHSDNQKSFDPRILLIKSQATKTNLCIATAKSALPKERIRLLRELLDTYTPEEKQEPEYREKLQQYRKLLQQSLDATYSIEMPETIDLTGIDDMQWMKSAESNKKRKAAPLEGSLCKEYGPKKGYRASSSSSSSSSSSGHKTRRIDLEQSPPTVLPAVDEDLNENDIDNNEAGTDK